MRSGKERKKKRSPMFMLSREKLWHDALIDEILTRKIFDDGPSKHTKRGLMRGRIRPRKDEGEGVSYGR